MQQPFEFFGAFLADFFAQVAPSPNARKRQNFQNPGYGIAGSRGHKKHARRRDRLTPISSMGITI